MSDRSANIGRLDRPERDDIAMPPTLDDMIDEPVVDSYFQRLKSHGEQSRLDDGCMRGIDYYRESELRSIVAQSLRLFWEYNGYLPDLFRPRSFNEFVFRRKFLESLKLPILCSKFYANRRVASALGERFAADIVYAGTSWEEAREKMRSQPTGVYFLKADHGSGLNRKFAWDGQAEAFGDPSLQEFSASYLRTAYGRETGEWQYGIIPKLFLIERSLTDDRIDPVDYRYFVFAGKTRIVCVDTQNYSKSGRHVTFFDERLTRLAMRYADYPVDASYGFPENMAAFTSMAETIAGYAGAPFVRIDLYDIAGHPVFGEVTYTPTSGTRVFDPPEYNTLLGDMWRSADPHLDAVSHPA